MPEPNKIIEIENLNFSYLTGQKVLKNVSLSINKGDRIVILGENGSGKSTLFLCLLHLIENYEGIIRIDGENMNHKSAKSLRKKFGMLFQESSSQLFLPTVREEIGFGPYNLGLRDEELTARINNTLKELSIPANYLQRKTMNLSHGEKKRISFASIFSMNPEIYLLDEPFVHLDPINRKSLQSIIKQLMDKQKTLILVTHDLDSIPPGFDRAIVLHKGSTIFNGNIHDLYSQPDLLKQANLDIPIIIKLFRKLVAEDILPNTIKIPGSIDDFYKILQEFRNSKQNT